MSCPACDCKEFSEEIISVKKDYSLTGYIYLVCSNCGSTYLNDEKITSQDELSIAHIENWYRSSNFQFAPDKTIEARIDLAERDSVSLTERFRLTCHSKVLDIGCGNGELVAAFARNGIDVYGFEQNEDAFKVLDVEAHLSHNLFKCSIEDLYENVNDLSKLHTCLKGRFDLIVLNDVLEHLYVPRKALQFLLDNLLSDGGAIYVQIPSGSSLQIKHLKEFAWNFMAPFHRTLFTKSGVKNIVASLSHEVEIIFIENNRRVWGNTRGFAHKAGFEIQHAQLRDNAEGFSRFDYLVDDFIDSLSIELNSPPTLTFALVK